MAKVYLGLGSNVNATFHLRQALDALAQHFGELELSPVYESESVGFTGDSFLNLVVALETELKVGELYGLLRSIEDDNGRDRSAPRFSERTLDIDILAYDNLAGTFDGVELPRDEIVKNAFVLRPLSDLAPNWLHPKLGATAAQLWQDYDKEKQQLWPFKG